MTDRDLKIQLYLAMEEKLVRSARAGDFTSFIKLTFPEYRIEWFHSYLIKRLEDVIAKKHKRVMIFLPPRHGKTELVSRRLPAFIHGLFPNDSILTGAYNADLAADNTIDVQRIMDTDTYRRVFPHAMITPEGTKTRYARSQHKHELIPIGSFIPKGSYRSAGVGGSFTGRGGNWLILDDPIKNRDDAESKVYRNKLWDFYTSSFRSRLEKDGSIVTMFTRWHEDDLAGRLLKQAKENPKADQWEVVSFPAIREEIKCGYDNRAVGEPLWTWKFSSEELEATQASNERDWISLYQQRPTKIEGNLVKRAWWGRHEGTPDEVLETVQFWDCAQKVGLTNDYSVCATWARTKNNYFVLDVWRGKLEAPDLEKKVQYLSSRFGPSAVVIEDKSSGSSLIQNLRRYTTLPIIAFDPGQKDKGVRISAAAPTIAAGKVSLPKYAEWVDTFITEHEEFPGEYDDQVDTTSMAISYFAQVTATEPSLRIF